MQGKLHIAAAGDIQFRDDVERRCPQHLVLLVAQRLRGRHNDAVTRVHPDRIDVFHVAYRDAVAGAVAHHLVLDLLPACDAALHEDLPHTREAQTVLEDLLQLQLVVGNTAAAAAEGVRRAQHHRITDRVRERHPVLDVFHDERRRTGFPDLLHGVLELLPVLRLSDRRRCRPQKPDIVGSQEPALLKLHAKVQPRLSSQRRQNGIRSLSLYDLLQNPRGQRFNIHLVRDIPVRHDSRGIGVHQHDLNALLLQGAARLCARIVKLRRLSDDDRSRTDHHYFFHIWILWHYLVTSVFPPSIISINLSNR